MILRSPNLAGRAKSNITSAHPNSRQPLHLIQESNFSTLARSKKVNIILWPSSYITNFVNGYDHSKYFDIFYFCKIYDLNFNKKNMQEELLGKKM